MKKWSLMLLILAFLIAIPALGFADEREIDELEHIGKKVEVEDSVGVLISKFGAPIYKDKVSIKAGWTGGVEREVKLWFYEIGGEYGIPKKSYKFMITDGIVSAIYAIE